MTSITIGTSTYFADGQPSIEDHTSAGVISFGSYTSIAPGVKFLLGAEHDHRCVSTFPFAIGAPISKGPIEIGSDVWIGRDAIVLSGVRIADGAVVGAGSVVAKDVPPYAVAVGSPIQVKSFRFRTHDVKRLLAIKWWEWPEDKVQEAKDLLSQHDLNAFFAFCDA